MKFLLGGENLDNNNIKVKFTIPIIYDRPNDNGVILTEKAVENAVNELRTNLPIVVNDKVIGVTTGTSHGTNWDCENKICHLVIDGILYNIGGRYECMIDTDNMGNNVINNFRIVSFGFTKGE